MVTLPGINKLRGTITEQQIRESILYNKNVTSWKFEHTPDFIQYMERHFGQSISSLYRLHSCCLPPYPPEDFAFDHNIHPDVVPLPYSSYNDATYLLNRQFIAFYQEIKSDGMLSSFVGPLQPFRFITFKEYRNIFRRQQIYLAILLDLAEEIPVTQLKDIHVHSNKCKFC